jgi:hypothetical protein
VIEAVSCASRTAEDVVRNTMRYRKIAFILNSFVDEPWHLTSTRGKVPAVRVKHAGSWTIESYQFLY